MPAEQMQRSPSRDLFVKASLRKGILQKILEELLSAPAHLLTPCCTAEKMRCQRSRCSAVPAGWDLFVKASLRKGTLQGLVRVPCMAPMYE